MSIQEIEHSASATTCTTWTTWRVAPGFEVDNPHGDLTLGQVDALAFEVRTAFRFADSAVLAQLCTALVNRGATPDHAAASVRAASTFRPSNERTDLASIPRFMRWFENTYGVHTLAAIIHDQLIVSGRPNGGALHSDVLADRFFRRMLDVSGVPPFKRWILWAAVAMRTRFAAGGFRRIMLIVWAVCAACGIALFSSAVGGMVFGWSRLFGASTLLLLSVALAGPLVCGWLWGRQWGVSVIAALAAFWILPAAVLAFAGYMVYSLIERLASGSRHARQLTASRSEHAS